MFDVGADLEKFILVGFVALLVLGPQRFPKVARDAGRWYRTGRQYVDVLMSEIRGTYAELERELAEDIPDLKEARDIAVGSEHKPESK